MTPTETTIFIIILILSSPFIIKYGMHGLEWGFDFISWTYEDQINTKELNDAMNELEKEIYEEIKNES